MKIEKIKPVPKYIVDKIRKLDKKTNPEQNGKTRYYAYLTTNDRELVKVTVAVKCKGKNWHYKQCAVHGIHSEDSFVKDMAYFSVGGYFVGWHTEGLTKYPKWYEYEKWWSSYDNLFDPFAPIVNKEYIAKFPEYQYSAYEQYEGVDILQYLRLHEEYPQIEYLTKLGLSRYAKSKQILKKAGADKRFRKWLSANRVELQHNFYYISSVIQSYLKNKPIKEVHAYESAKKELCKPDGYKPIREMCNGDYEQYLAYICKQQISNSLYLDYLNACNYLGLDMSEEKNRFPHDFQKWHDIRIDEYATAKAIKDEEERKELYAKFALIAEKYSALQYDKKGEYVVFLSKSPAELIQEGEMLHHCVGRMGYDQKFIREETLIFFIRPKELPETPFVTVEYSLKDKRILQCYADGNKKPAESVIQYVNKKWLPYANRKLKQIAV